MQRYKQHFKNAISLYKSYLNFQVRQRNFFTKRETCGVIKIVQHSRCKCGCSVMKHHCTEKQEYRPSECRCACKNSDDQHKCAAEVI